MSLIWLRSMSASVSLVFRMATEPKPGGQSVGVRERGTPCLNHLKTPIRDPRRREARSVAVYAIFAGLGSAPGTGRHLGE